MDEWNGMNNTENNGGMSGLLEGTLSNAMYNVAIGVHLLVGLIVTYFLALRMPYLSCTPDYFLYRFFGCGTCRWKYCGKRELCFILNRLRYEYFGFRYVTFLSNYSVSGAVHRFGGGFDHCCCFNDDDCRRDFFECISLYGKNDFYRLNRSCCC